MSPARRCTPPRRRALSGHHRFRRLLGRIRNEHTRRQLEVLANLALESHAIAFDIALIFFGCACLVEGYLLYKSGYFPKFIGVLMQIAGSCYLISCFADLLAPAIADLIAPAILLPPLLGELSYGLWLLIKGVDVGRWNERSKAGGATPASA